MEFFDRDFWQGFVSNGMATLLGVALGIPIGLFLDKLSQHARKKERRKNERYLLENIKEELGWALKRAAQRNSTLGDFGRDKFKNNFWTAACNGGLISNINALNLLNEIASAYFAIEIVMEIEREGFKLVISSNPKDTEAAKNLLPQLRNYLVRLEGNARRALSEIDERIEKLNAMLEDRKQPGHH